MRYCWLVRSRLRKAVLVKLLAMVVELHLTAEMLAKWHQYVSVSVRKLPYVTTVPLDDGLED